MSSRTWDNTITTPAAYAAVTSLPSLGRAGFTQEIGAFHGDMDGYRYRDYPWTHCGQVARLKTLWIPDADGVHHQHELYVCRVCRVKAFS